MLLALPPHPLPSESAETYMTQNKEKPWQGRFSGETSKLVEEFTSSLDFDRRLYRYDIAGSIAHARMLGKQGILTQAEVEKIVAGLETVRGEIDRGEFVFEAADEDIHMAVERRLTALIGEVGRKLHTARSRNDQVALDVRLYLRDQIKELLEALQELRRAGARLARRYFGVIIPGYTHMQRAQPVLYSHHLLAYDEMWRRDQGRLRDCSERFNVLPLGAAALAGTTFPIDPAYTAELLDFPALVRNSLDAVSDRDFYGGIRGGGQLDYGSFEPPGGRVDPVVFGRICFYHYCRFLLHRLVHHAAKEKSGCGRVNPG